FLVGCPRSGTTLLQSLIAAHQDVVSFPETFFFTKVVPSPMGRRHRLHVASAQAPTALRDLDALGVAADPARPALPSVTVRGYARRFVRRMDRAAAEAGAGLWLEKTPSHVRHISRIEAEVAGARFIHIVREGEAVVASLRDAHERDPEAWPSSAALDLVGLWKLYVGLSTPWVGRHNHAFVSYERLVADTESVLRAVCAFLGLRAEDGVVEELLNGYTASSERVIGRVLHAAGSGTLRGEPWKQDVTREIGNRNQDKFRSLFNEAERRQISAEVAPVRETLCAIPFL
ncbi:MAG: sulfotransferase family protein, partial [Solirubrobacteraceae bacterium]